jgi:two-component system C4-dicarboxylate transport sensor histidine kinase DctB
MLISRRFKFILTLVLIFITTTSILLWLRHATDAVRVEVRARFFDQYNRQQYLMAELASRTLEEMFSNFQHSLDLAASLFEGQEVNQQRVSEVMATLKKINGTLANTAAAELTVFDVHGTVIAMDPLDTYTLGRNYAWRDYYLWTKNQGKPGQTYLSPFMRMEGGIFRGDKALILAEGIYSPKGDFQGVVIFVLNVNELVRKNVLSVRIGKAGYAWLVDTGNRTVLVNPKGNTNGKSFEEAYLPKWRGLYDLLISTQDGKPGSAWYDYEAPDDPSQTVRKLVSYHPIHIGNQLWTLGVATPEKEVEALLSTFMHRQEIISNSFLVTTLAAAFALLMVVLTWNSFLSDQVNLHTKDLRKARSRLESTFDELLAAQKVAAVGRLALGLVHEIRNPLSAIQMNMQMIRKRIDTTVPLQENFTIVEGEIQRLNRLLKDMMDFARTRPLNLQPTALGALTERLVQLMAQNLTMQQIETEINIPPALTLVCDPEQLHQLLLNLVLNAIEAMKDIPRQRRLVIAATVQNDNVLIRVSDSGKGIPPELIEMLFDPFVTTKASGGGLGLSVLQVIVFRHGGSVSVDSEPDTGTSFSITLPQNGPTQVGKEDS